MRANLTATLSTLTTMTLTLLTLGGVLLLVALRAPLIAFLGTMVSLLSTAAAFGVARLIFQDGHGSGLLGFTPQGFLDGWGPVFFFAMIISVILSWVAPNSYNPGAQLVNQICEPLLAPFRKLLPNLGGLDISPIFAFIALILVLTLRPSGLLGERVADRA